MKHQKLLILLCLSGFLAAGCQKADTSSQKESETLSEQTMQTDFILGDLSNLDCSVIESEIPLPDQLYKMESRGEGEWNDDKIYKEFPKLIAAYGGPKEDELDAGKDILIETWKDANRSFVSLDEWNQEEIFDIMYCSDSLYFSMNSIRQIFTFQPDIVTQITDEDWERPYVWLINEHAEPIQTYEIGKDDITGISYRLDGQEVSLEEAIIFAEKTMTENKDLPLISTPGFEYRVESVQIYQFGKNNALHFTMNLYYQGIKLAPELNGAPENANASDVSYIPTLNKCTMFQKDKLGGIYIFDFLNEKQDSTAIAKPTINYKKALQILSGYLSNEHVFKILDAELVYSFYVKGNGDTADGVNHISPVWQFEVSTEMMQQYSKLFILIDVESGEIIEVC